MNDTEFIELLNLYLDHEISADDAARLEAEVQKNPARRRVYQQYCRMQKACKMVASDFTEADQAGDVSEKKVVAFNPAIAAAEARRKRIGTLYTIGTFAAVAACVAIVFVGQSRKASEAAQAIEQSRSIAQSVPTVTTIPNPDATFVAGGSAEPRGLVRVASPSQQMLLVRDPLLLTGTSQAEAVRVAAVNQANNQLAWIESVHLTPLEQQRVDADLHFAATLKPEGGRPLGNRANVSPKVGKPAEEMLMFQFVK